MNKTPTLPRELDQATNNLIENLCASEPFWAYQQAQARINADPPACALLERLATLQAELRRTPGRNTVTQSDLDELRAVQIQVQTNTLIMTYAQSQQNAVNCLREINQEISQLSGIDFAALAKQTIC